MKAGMDENVNVIGKMLRSQPGVLRHPSNAPIRLPRKKVTTMAMDSNASVQGSAREIISTPCVGNAVSE